MARPTQAQTEIKSASLAEKFGYDYAVWLFGEEAIASLPVLKAGKNKGKPKGFVLWKRTTTAGYHVNAGQGVSAGTTIRAWIGVGPYSGENDALQGKWLGRVQSVCGSMHLLGPKGREAEEARQERERAELERRYAEFDAEARQAG